MRVLSIIHGANARSGIFGDVVREAGHELVERSYAFGEPPPEAPETYDAVMVFGGVMNVHEVDGHPWLGVETRALECLLENEVPVLGVCLGAQLLASAAGAEVSRAQRPEIGWYEVETTDEARDDALFSGTPDRFDAFHWHSYQFDHPPDAVLLARSPVCLQAYRIRETCWGIQFHAEVSKQIAADWISHYGKDPDAIRIGLDPERERRRLDDEIERWNEFGRTLIDRFLVVAGERAGVAPQRARA
ncbi:MAG: type 1 glutamine amidotransferase [Actinobacteria bacterium]|nr:type 1 glutamine amidotransferase [Actinomycetota bacterium]